MEKEFHHLDTDTISYVCSGCAQYMQSVASAKPPYREVGARLYSQLSARAGRERCVRRGRALLTVECHSWQGEVREVGQAQVVQLHRPREQAALQQAQLAQPRH